MTFQCKAKTLLEFFCRISFQLESQKGEVILYIPTYPISCTIQILGQEEVTLFKALLISPLVFVTLLLIKLLLKICS